jgi:tRNA(His) 5'-end guanylyltransferase
LALTADFDLTTHEVFSEIKIPPKMPFFVRLDGRDFHVVAETLKVERPYDRKFARCFVNVAKAVFQGGFDPVLAYTFSDEVNILFVKEALFGGRVEKINSVLAGVASSAFTLAIATVFKWNLIVAFDSRVIPVQENLIHLYLNWRQRMAWRNHLNASAYWLMQKLGHKPREAQEKLRGLKAEEIHNFLFTHGINLNETPLWQGRGVLIYKKPYEKFGRTGEIVTRMRLTENWNLPLFSTRRGHLLIQQLVKWARQSKS